MALNSTIHMAVEDFSVLILYDRLEDSDRKRGFSILHFPFSAFSITGAPVNIHSSSLEEGTTAGILHIPGPGPVYPQFLSSMTAVSGRLDYAKNFQLKYQAGQLTIQKMQYSSGSLKKKSFIKNRSQPIPKSRQTSGLIRVPDLSPYHSKHF